MLQFDYKSIQLILRTLFTKVLITLKTKRVRNAKQRGGARNQCGDLEVIRETDEVILEGVIGKGASRKGDEDDAE